MTDHKTENTDATKRLPPWRTFVVEIVVGDQIVTTTRMYLDTYTTRKVTDGN